MKDQNPSEVVTISSETEENLECDQSDESGDANQNSSGSGGSETKPESSSEEQESADEGKCKSFRIIAKKHLTKRISH